MKSGIRHWEVEMDITKCDSCGSFNLKVTDSRNRYGQIWRTRVCSDCGNRFYTVEIERTEYRKCKDILGIYRSMKGIMKKLEGLDGE